METKKKNSMEKNAVERYFVVFYWTKEDKYLFYSFDTLERVLYQKSIYPNAKSTIIKGVEVDNEGLEIIEDKTPIKCPYKVERYKSSGRSYPKNCPLRELEEERVVKDV